MATNTGLAGVLDQHRGKNALLKQFADEVAVDLFFAFFATSSGESISRRNAITRTTQQLGLGGPERREAARVLAEGWQVLANAGVVCPDPEQQGDWWFLTRLGTQLIQVSPDEVRLQLGGRSRA